MPVTQKLEPSVLMNLECGANDMGGGLSMNHLPHPCFIRVHRWLRIKGIWVHLRSSADSQISSPAHADNCCEHLRGIS